MPKLPRVPKKYFEHRLASSTEAKSMLKKMAATLKQLREGRGWTLREVAEKAGCSFNVVWHFEQAHNFPSFAAYVALCRVFDQPKPPLT